MAIGSPLLEESIVGAKGILFTITGGDDLAMYEVNEASHIITQSADPDANIIFGIVKRPNMTGEVKITVVATGFPEEQTKKPQGHASLMKRAFSAFDETSNKPQEKPQGNPNRLSDDDIDTPAFLRNRLK